MLKRITQTNGPINPSQGVYYYWCVEQMLTNFRSQPNAAKRQPPANLPWGGTFMNATQAIWRSSVRSTHKKLREAIFHFPHKCRMTSERKTQKMGTAHEFQTENDNQSRKFPKLARKTRQGIRGAVNFNGVREKQASTLSLGNRENLLGRVVFKNTEWERNRSDTLTRGRRLRPAGTWSWPWCLRTRRA